MQGDKRRRLDAKAHYLQPHSPRVTKDAGFRSVQLGINLLYLLLYAGGACCVLIKSLNSRLAS